jgi:hypothetical protein
MTKVPALRINVAVNIHYDQRASVKDKRNLRTLWNWYPPTGGPPTGCRRRTFCNCAKPCPNTLWRDEIKPRQTTKRRIPPRSNKVKDSYLVPTMTPRNLKDFVRCPDFTNASASRHTFRNPATRFTFGTLSPTLGYLREGLLQARPSRPVLSSSVPPVPLQQAPASRLGPARQAGLSLRTGLAFSHPQSGPANPTDSDATPPQRQPCLPYSSTRSQAARASYDSCDWAPCGAAARRLLASRVMALAPLTGTIVGFKLRGLQDNVAGDLLPSSPRGPDALLATGARDQVSATAPSRQAIRWGGGSSPTHPRCSPAVDDKGVRPPWAAHNYLQDSGHCRRGTSFKRRKRLRVYRSFLQRWIL